MGSAGRAGAPITTPTLCCSPHPHPGSRAGFLYLCCLQSWIFHQVWSFWGITWSGPQVRRLWVAQPLQNPGTALPCPWKQGEMKRWSLAGHQNEWFSLKVCEKSRAVFSAVIKWEYMYTPETWCQPCGQHSPRWETGETRNCHWCYEFTVPPGLRVFLDDNF